LTQSGTAADTSDMRSRIDELLPFAEENEGLVTAAQARSLGIKDSVLARLTQRGKLQRVARGVYRIPYFPSDRLGQYRAAILWARADSGPKKIALSHETALAVYGISDANPSRVQITVPKSARLRRRRPKWVEIHRADLRASDIVNREGLPVTTIEKAISQLLEETGRVGLARGALKDARKQGYISAEKASALTRRLNRYVHAKAAQEANGGKV
jgi:predicted transcriptional regulator of viral defense system